MDTIIEEIRRYREEYAKSQDYDLYKIYYDLKEKQKKVVGKSYPFYLNLLDLVSNAPVNRPVMFINKL